MKEECRYERGKQEWKKKTDMKEESRHESRKKLLKHPIKRLILSLQPSNWKKPSTFTNPWFTPSSLTFIHCLHRFHVGGWNLFLEWKKFGRIALPGGHQWRSERLLTLPITVKLWTLTAYINLNSFTCLWWTGWGN